MKLDSGSQDDYLEVFTSRPLATKIIIKHEAVYE